MGTIIAYSAYHVTDANNVESIKKNNFTFQSSEEHWLGDGIYFFLDSALAKKWGESKPTYKFGSINKPIVLKANIVVDESEVIDMRFLDDYNAMKNAFDSYWCSVCSLNKALDKANYKKIRCAFFNACIKKTGCKCLIAYLSERNNLADYTEYYREFAFLKTPYMEVQMCVTDNSVINDISEE
jgi:hypothetical protein